MIFEAGYLQSDYAVRQNLSRALDDVDDRVIVSPAGDHLARVELGRDDLAHAGRVQLPK